MRMLQKTPTSAQFLHFNNTYLQAKYAEVLKGGKTSNARRLWSHQTLGNGISRYTCLLLDLPSWTKGQTSGDKIKLQTHYYTLSKKANPLKLHLIFLKLTKKTFG